jgi:hypothetical protein
MESTIDLTIAVASLLAIAVGCLLRRQARGPHPIPATAEWIDELSTERYLPMVRLLSERDVRYLKAHGYTRVQVRSFRRERCRLFREYLRSLQHDFECVVSAMRVVLAVPHDDHPGLVLQLFRQRVIFDACLVVIHCRLWLFQRGIGGVSAENMLEAFGRLSVELRLLVRRPIVTPATVSSALPSPL